MTGHATACQAPSAALVVDDDAGVRQSLRLWLETAGARVLGVATGRGALEALDRESTNARRDGQFRRIAVRVERSGVVARTRPGYYASGK